MQQIIYSSRASRDFSDQELECMLERFSAANAKSQITGLLLYAEKRFLQLIEGPKEQVTELLNRIAFDSRHAEVQVLSDCSITERMFPDWSMGFQRLSKDSLPGFSRVFESALGPEHPGEQVNAWELSTLFKSLKR